MAMAALQRHGRSLLQNVLAPVATRSHHNFAEVPQHHSSMGIPFPRILTERETAMDAPRASNSEDSSSVIRNPFMDLMAVPKRKVTPSRKGKRNGPKAYKPITVIAKCKVCGRVKLPHLYCCSGEVKL